jgi:hypothetical protein
VGQFFAKLAETADAKLEGAAVEVSEMAATNVRTTFGDHQKLEELKDATIASKASKLYANLEAPLVAMTRFVGGVGTEDPKMLYHQLGTPRVPPRPVFQIAAAESHPEQAEIAKISCRCHRNRPTDTPPAKELSVAPVSLILSSSLKNLAKQVFTSS